VTLPVRVRLRAELDIDEAYAWYESRAEGLGEAFLRAVEACFARIERLPEARDPESEHRPHHRGHSGRDRCARGD
jgi:plasmid stabilization system protein ParE